MYRLQTPLQSELPDGRVGINARVIRIEDEIEVGKFLHIAADAVGDWADRYTIIYS